MTDITNVPGVTAMTNMTYVTDMIRVGHVRQDILLYIVGIY